MMALLGNDKTSARGITKDKSVIKTNGWQIIKIQTKMHLLLTTTPLADHLIQAFSWMLIHSLWQGLLLAVFTAVVLLFTRRSSAAVRYNLVLVPVSIILA